MLAGDVSFTEDPHSFVVVLLLKFSFLLDVGEYSIGFKEVLHVGRNEMHWIYLGEFTAICYLSLGHLDIAGNCRQELKVATMPLVLTL